MFMHQILRSWFHSIATCRIWNTYKDEYARTRKRELSIIE